MRRAHYTAILLLAACLTLTSAACHAVTMDAEAGFGTGLLKESCWTPVTVKLSNPDNAPVNGTLILSSDMQQGENFPTCTASVDLPANSEKLYHIYLRTDSTDKLNVSLISRRGEVAKQKISISPIPKESMTVLSVSSRESCPLYLSGEKISVPPKKAPDTSGRYYYTQQNPPLVLQIYVASISGEKLPDRPAAFSGIDMMILTSTSIASAKPRALDAIKMWVASGGKLVVSTGPRFGEFTGSFYDELLPVKVTGAAQLPSLNIMNIPVALNGPIAVTNSTVKPGISASVRHAGGIPVYASRRYGLGEVIFIAFDCQSPTFTNWSAKNDFWRALLREPTARDIIDPLDYEPIDENNYYYANRVDETGLYSLVMENSFDKAPSTGVITCFLLAYLVILSPVNYFILKRKCRLELAWVSVPLIIAVFAIGAYGIGYFMKGGSYQTKQAFLLQGSSGCRYAAKQVYASVFSPSMHSYGLSGSDPFALGQEIYLIKYKAHRFPTAYIGDEIEIEDVETSMWASKPFEFLSGEDLGGSIKSDLRRDGTRLTGTITNNTKFDLEDCVIFYRDNSVKKGTLRAGSTIEVNVSNSNYSPRPRKNNPSSMKLADKYNNLIEDSARKLGEPVLTAKIAGSQPPVKLQASRVNDESVSYAAFYLDIDRGGSRQIEKEKISGRVTISADFLEPGSAATTLLKFEKPASCTVEYSLPIPRGAAVDEFTVSASWNSSDSYVYDTPKASIYNNKTGKWDRVPLDQGCISGLAYVDRQGQVKITADSTRSTGSSATYIWIDMDAWVK